MLEIQSLSAGQWMLLKMIRLKVLADAPDAFSTSFAQAQEWPDKLWRKRAEHFAMQSSATARIAYQAGQTCSMICCVYIHDLLCLY